MITVKLLGHDKQPSYAINCRGEGQRLFKDISEDGKIVDPVEIFKGGLLESTKVTDDEDSFEVNMILSDGELDRDEERILTKGWDLTNFKKNPVLLWGHEKSRPAIGTVKGLSKGDNLSGIIVFVDKAVDHFGWSIGQKVSKGIIRAGSVGFMPKSWRFIDDPEDPAWLEFEKQELYEFSICNVPANPRALVQDSIIMNPYKEMKSINDQLLELTKLLKGDNTENRTEDKDKSVDDLFGKILASVQQDRT